MEEQSAEQEEYEKKPWITYVNRKPNGQIYTISEVYDENDPEHDLLPNTSSFLALFKGDNVNETLAEAQKFIKKIQREEIENISFNEIRRINAEGRDKIERKESYVLLPNGQGYRIKTLDEMKKEQEGK